MSLRVTLALLLGAGLAGPPGSARAGWPGFACEGAGEPANSVFLVGDAGAPELPAHPEAELPVDRVLLSLRSDVTEQAAWLGVDRVAVVYLGDNVHPRGLGEERRKRGERVLSMLIAAAGPVRVLFTAGERDWGGDEVDPDRVQALGRFVAERGARAELHPAAGCPGPSRVDLGERLRFVFVDPLGFARIETEPGALEACGHASSEAAWAALAGELAEDDGRHVVLALHHPLRWAVPQRESAGLRQHLFPLTELWRPLWLPLPGIGTLAVLARSLAEPPLEVPTEPMLRVARAVHRAARLHSPLLIAAAHLPALELYRDSTRTWTAVSGAGSEALVSGRETGGTPLFAASAPGYLRLESHVDGALGLTALALGDGPRAQPAFAQCLRRGASAGDAS